MTVEQQENKLKSTEILGFRVHCMNMQEVINRLEYCINTNERCHLVTADASMMVMAQKDLELKNIILHAELVTPDSAGVLWAAKRSGVRLSERVSGVDIVEKFCKLSADKEYRIFFFGASEGVAEKAANRMRSLYPGAQIVGTRSGFYTDDDIPDIIKQIKGSKPDMLCVALGIPKQEKWINCYRNELGVPVLIGIGGTLDVLSGNVKRAPQIMQKLHLEWLWRLLSNPRKISKVMLLPRFVKLVLWSNGAAR